MVKQDLNKLQIRKTKDLTHIRNCIKKLEERKEIVIRPADKGGAICNPLQGSIFITNAETTSRHHHISKTSRKLLGNPTIKYKKELEQLVKKGWKKGILNEKEGRDLVPDTC